MINTDRIVPVQASDLISVYSTMLGIANVSFAVLKAGAIGEFNITDGTSTLLADEPVKTATIDDGVSSFTMYFVPDYDFKGFYAEDGTKATTSGTVNADGRSLYKAVLATGTVTFTQMGK